MSRNLLLVPLLLLATTFVPAEDAPESKRDTAAVRTHAQDGVAETARAAGAEEAEASTQEGPKVISGMSILGNQEAPKSLVIVPWKSSVLGDSLGISTMLDDSRQPVDKEVFMRALGYYEIRTESTP